jgi:hypothetical protein
MREPGDDRLLDGGLGAEVVGDLSIALRVVAGVSLVDFRLDAANDDVLAGNGDHRELQ